MWAFLLSVVGVGVTVFGTQTSAYLFGWDSGDTLVHRDRIVAGGALLLASALIWWRLERRTPAIVSGTIAGISVSVAYAAPGWLFLLALGSPVVAIVGVGGAILGLASGTGRRSSAGLLGLGATVVALATAAVFGLAPGLGLIAAVGVVVAGGAVATLAVQRAQRASARDPD